MACAVPGIPMITSGDDLVAVIAPRLNTVQWPDGYIGLRGDDVVVLCGKILAKAQGRWCARGKCESGFRSRAGLPEKLDLQAPVEVAAAAGQIRRGLAARFGGRPGVVITASASEKISDQGAAPDRAIAVAGVDWGSESGDAVAHAIAALAGLVAQSNPNCPVVVVRGLPDILTWED